MYSADASNREFKGQWTASALVVLLCTGISLSNAIELVLLVITTFKKRSGLYFWSLLVTSFAVLPYSIGFLIYYIRITPLLLGDIMNNIGWIIMVCGQSVVLYSRLGIIYHNPKVLRLILVMIVADGAVFYLITTIVHYGTYSNNKTFLTGAHIMEKIQMTGFSIQEFIISGFYVREVIRYDKIVKQDHARRTVWELFVINIIIVVLDVALLTLEYLDFTILEQAFKGLAYSFKLKMEFAILGKLVDMAKARILTQDTPDGVGLGVDDETLYRGRSKSNVTYASFV